MKGMSKHRPDDLIADIMSILSPLIFCCALLLLLDPLGCCVLR